MNPEKLLISRRGIKMIHDLWYKFAEKELESTLKGFLIPGDSSPEELLEVEMDYLDLCAKVHGIIQERIYSDWWNYLSKRRRVDWDRVLT